MGSLKHYVPLHFWRNFIGTPVGPEIRSVSVILDTEDRERVRERKKETEKNFCVPEEDNGSDLTSSH